MVYSRLFVLIAIFALVFLIAVYATRESVDCTIDCVGINLMSRDLSGQNLSKADLIEANFQFSNLRNVNLRGADLSGANLEGANLQYADLRQTKLIGANLAGADLRNAILDDTDFSGADLSHVDLTKADLTTVILVGTILDGAKLVETDLHNTNLTGITLYRADLTGANLDGAQLSGGVLSGADLSGSSAVGSNMSGAWINLANLTGADFSNSTLAGSTFIGTNLTSVNFTDSDLVGGVFIGAKLNGATLRGADLSGTRLFLSELNPNDLAADPLLAELNELQRSFILVNVDLSGVIFNRNTIWPAGKSTPLAAMLGSRFQAYSGLDDTISIEERIASVSSNGYFALPAVDPAQVQGDITVVGSEMLAPLTEAISSIFSTQGYTGTIFVEESSTADGLQKYCDGIAEVDLVHANRLVTLNERSHCRENRDIPYSIQVGYGAILIIINPTNPFLSDITSEQLPLLFTAERWSDIDPLWPATPIIRYLPNSNTDTYNYFVNTVFAGDETGLLNASNTLMTDKSNIILGVTSDSNAIGLVIYPYYQQNIETIGLLTIDGFAPTQKTISTREYPFAYPLYLYTDKKSASENQAITDFLNFYLNHSNLIAEEVGYFPLSTQQLDQQEYRFLNLLGFGTDEK